MHELTSNEVLEISAGKFKWHVNPFHVVFTTFAGFLAGGPVGAGLALGAAIAAQGTGELHQIYVDEFGNQQRR